MVSGNYRLINAQHDAESRGHELIVWHQCTGLATPVPVGSTNISHYRVMYGWQWTMNPWTGSLENVDLTTADMGQYVEIDLVLPKDKGEKMTESEKQAFVSMAFLFIRGSAPADGVQQFASQISDDGSNVLSVVDSILNSPEGQEKLPRLQNLLNGQVGSGVTMADVKAEIVKTLKAGEAGA